MFTCKEVKTGTKYLSKHLCANDYYEKGGHVVGRWVGKGAALLGLEGKDIGHRDEAFESLRKNLNPNTGENLTPRTSSERRAFYDFQISAPKDVSILAVTYGDERLLAAHRKAVEAGYAELQRLAARHVHHRGDHNRSSAWITGNLITAAFDHTASQELDAQVHTHLVCVNATYDEQAKQWYALDNSEMFRGVQVAGRVYQAALAKEVRALGYEIEEQRNEKGRIKGFTIAGVTEQDRDVQSTRRKQIEAEIEKFKKERGRNPTSRERHVMATETRAKKLQETTTPEVIAKQLAKYSPADQERLRQVVASARARGPLPLRDASPQMLLEWAIEHVFERKAVATDKDILVAALEENLGRTDIEQLRAQLAASKDVIRVADVEAGRPAEDALRATVENLRRERESIELVNSAVGQHARLGDAGGLAGFLSEDQRNALTTVLNSTDGIVALRGPAGAGKTTALKELAAAVERSGSEAVFTTPQHMGRITMEANGIKNPQTVSQFLMGLRNGSIDIRGKVLVVDEAGQLSTKAGHEVLAAARDAGARVVLVGDEKQLSAVEAGDFFAILKNHSRITWAELRQIRRQKDPAYREAIQAMSRGDVKHGLTLLDAQQRIFESHGDYLDRAADSYVEKTHAGKSTILVAPTWDEIDQLNARVRAGRRVRGEIAGELGAGDRTVQIVDLADYSAAQRRVGRHYKPGMVISPMAPRTAGLRKGAWYEVASVQGNILTLKNGRKVDVSRVGRRLNVGTERAIALAVGDLLMLQGNDRKLGVTNGMFARVEGIDASGITIQAKREDGTFVTKLPPTYMTFTHGYAVTAHKSQSATVEHAIVAATRVNGAGVYVATSRGERSVEIYVPDKKRLMASAPDEIVSRAAAVDYAGAREAAAPPRRRERVALSQFRLVQRLYNHRRVQQTITRIREAARSITRRGRT